MKQCYSKKKFLYKFIQRSISVVLAFLFCTAFLPFIKADGSDYQHEIIKVGYPINPGLSEIDENGKYSGYTYEYLQEIAQYTGWEYEFIQIKGSQNEVLTKMYDMLAKGEIDLMGDTNYSKELDELYDYPVSNYGSVYSTLEVLQQNTSINDANYRSLDNIRIAVLSHAKNGIASLKEFCINNNINPELVYCKNDAELISALNEKRADALLSNDMAATKGTRIVARFNPKPFYFVTTAGNYHIITALHSAMMMLNNADPYFSTTLHQKYFSNEKNLLQFTDAEKAYLNNTPVLRVGITTNRLPLENTDSKGNSHGISLDLLQSISNDTGLKFEISSVASPVQLLENLYANNIDLALGVTYDYNNSQTYNFSMSKPYISAQMVMAIKEGVNPYELNGKRLALPRGLSYSDNYSGHIIWYNSIAECLKAVNSGEADYCYGNGYSIEYYCNLYRYTHLLLIPQSSQINQYCIAVARPADPLLLTVLNKTIHNISAGELQTMIYQNSTPSNKGITLLDVMESNPTETLVILSTFIFFLFIILTYFAWFQRQARQKVQIENERYQLLAEMSGEYLFEYDCTNDRLTLTDKTSQTFGGKTIQENYYKNILALKSDYADWIRSIFNNVNEQKSFVSEHQVVLSDGNPTWLRVTIATIRGYSGGRVNYLIGKIADIQQEKSEKDSLARRAQRDALTGLYNIAETKFLTEQILINHSSNSPGTLLIMDIDHFKSINDRFGHYTGDEVLQSVARLLSNVFREDDIIGRLGGDEFIVFLKDVHTDNVIYDKCHALQQDLTVYSLTAPMPITLSIGAAIAADGIRYDALYKQADNALYDVKAAGRNGFKIAPLPPSV
ncbi:MAG: transporter substrate-binding domain-containing protein [Oscillospiraceae bacterium]